MYRYEDKCVVVTGASMGIGEAFALELAERGARLVLVARSRDKLERLATRIARDAKHAPVVVALDLGRPGAAERLVSSLRERSLEVDVLINNAGFATYGPFEDVSLAEQSAEIALNVQALVELSHALLPDIVARRGGIMQIASTAAFQPVPFMAVYGATKAFVLSFSEALWAELRPRGVRVLAVCPGATDTPFFARVGAEEASLGKKAPPAAVVASALRAFDKNRSHVVCGTGNYLTAQLARVFPRETTARITAGLMKPRTPRLATKGAAS